MNKMATLRRRAVGGLAGLVLAGLLGAGSALAADSGPGMQFQHYTFALLWQPGVCATWTHVEPACNGLNASSRASQQWSLHGLWASRPQKLVDAGMAPKTWWQHGCFWFQNQSEAPHDSCSLPSLNLSPGVSADMSANMPMRKVCLDRHEYFKHEACFGEKPDPFFHTALGLLGDVNASSFTAFVRDHRGQWVQRNALLQAYTQAFHLPNAQSIELRCESNDNHSGHELHGEGNILTEAWITIRANAIQEFPRPAAFMDGRKGNCAKLIHILP
ncbi:ribonuclease I [Acidithiobacillus sp. IBUN Pt1247-S3]|uniref:ribonuclease T2 family protein n=1 Tax=Acidithiobacillus sp. IBUN Pt1247-S3 TaxID=3166642 RepID=UPI0034E5595F